VDEYKERLLIIEKDLEWLLHLSYQKFWSQIVYDKSCQKMIDSYLKLAPRPHDISDIKKLPQTIQLHHNNIHRYTFLVCLRMSTFKESQVNYLTPEGFASIIYNNFLFDIPKILDICVLYKHNSILSKMVNNLFDNQPKYFDDFNQCIKDITRAIEINKRTFQSIFELDPIYRFEAANSSSTTSLNDRIHLKLKEILETMYYLTDFTITLNDLIELVPNVTQLLYKQKFELFIGDFIETTLFGVKDVLTKIKKQNNNNNKPNDSIVLMIKKLKTLKNEFTSLFHRILINICVTPIMETFSSSQSSVKNDLKSIAQTMQQQNEKPTLQTHIDKFIKLCSDLLEFRRFASYYEHKHQLSDQIEMIFQISGNKIDKSQYNFLMNNLKTVVGEHSSHKQKPKEVITVATTSTATSKTSKPTNNIDPAELASMISSVTDLFPHYEIDFIKQCLNYYNYNIEEVINSMLEGNLPDFSSLNDYKDKEEEEEDIDLNEFSDPEDYELFRSTTLNQFNELKARRNIYDGDNFDVFKNEPSNIEIENIKANKNKTDTFDLNDKSEIDKTFYKNYDHIMHKRAEDDAIRRERDRMREREYGIKILDEMDQYEDEYDDTYDNNYDANDNDEPESFIK
jgi:activating signal cointegrator complex subunit 2